LLYIAKYRPSTFSEVVGQEQVTEPLMNALSNDRIHHAYLFQVLAVAVRHLALASWRAVLIAQKAQPQIHAANANLARI
jgi:replication-associated recombination protein RarA